MKKYVPKIDEGRTTIAPDVIVRRLANSDVQAVSVTLHEGQTAPDFESIPEGMIYGPATVRYFRKPDGGITQEIVWTDQ